MEYQGHAFNEQLKEGKSKGIISINAHEIAFKYTEDEIVTMPLNGLNIEMGGASGRLVYFSHKSQPDWTFFTSEKKVLKDKSLENNSSAKELRRKTKRRRGLAFILITILMHIISFSAIGIYRSYDKIIFTASKHVPIEWEQDIGSKIFALLSNDKKIIKDKYLKDKLALITNPITSTVENNRFKFKFYIVQDTALNAFALPGGTVIVNSGLLLKAENAEEVAGVIAHEISHVTLRHHIRALIGKAGILVIIQTAIGDPTSLIGMLVNSGTLLTTLQFSRKFETQADTKGLFYLNKASINPQGMIDFFKLIKSQSPQSSINNSLELLNTHPNIEKRIKMLKGEIKKQNNNKFININLDFKLFKEHLNKILNPKEK